VRLATASLLQKYAKKNLSAKRQKNEKRPWFSQADENKKRA
jgi:hypothetical protein